MGESQTPSHSRGVRLVIPAASLPLAAAGFLFLILGIAGRFAYYRTYSFFSSNDDEGYILQSIQSYLQGQPLFDEVFSQYGPGFYALEYLIHGILGAPLTHDFERLAVVAVWISTSLVCSLIVLRLTRSWVGAFVSFVAVFVHLIPLINEPGHPQVPLVLAISLVCLSATWFRDEGAGTVSLTVAAILTAFAALTKVNIGAYLLLALTISMALLSRPERFPLRQGIAIAALAAGCAAPLFVTRAYNQGWAATYGLIVALSVASAWVAIVGSATSRFSSRALLVYLGTSTGICAAVAAITLLQGTSIRGLIHGTLVRPAQFADVFSMPLVLPSAGVLAAAVGLLLSLALTSRWLAPRPWAVWIVAACKLLVAATALPLWLETYPGQIAYLTPFLWIVAVNPAGSRLSGQLASRGTLALVAVLQSLQAYPVAGTQLVLATFLILPIGCICALDAVAIVSAVSRRPILSSRVLKLAVFFAAWFAYRPLLDSRPWRTAYDVQYDLRLKGAQRLRVPAVDAARYHWLSGTAALNCRTLVTLPGLYSLHLWSGIPPVTGKNVTAWMTLLTESEQQVIWRAVDSAERPCAILNETLAANWVAGRPLPQLASYAALTARFAAVATFDGYQFMLPRGQAQPPVMRLVFGRHAFERRRPALPVAAPFVAAQPVSTLRTWIRTYRNGVILGCQSTDRWGPPARNWVPMIYVGNTGRLHAQHRTTGLAVQATPDPVNDGRWHHVALVRDGTAQRLFVDGRLAGSLNLPIDRDDLGFCQAGTGITEEWPDGPRGWMPFNGEIDGVDVELRAWTAPEIESDRIRTRPYE